MRIVVAGHVDHGKSTVIGRLLADTGSLPEGKLEAVRAHCARHARPFEYAFLLDALRDEQAQGITIDAARIFFQTAHRQYLILDAPGHIEFLRNMVTGASHSDAALLVVDALEGVQENSRRHGYLLGMLGVEQVVVLVNKMDLVGNDRRRFEEVAAEYREFLGKLGVHPAHLIPVAARDGANIATRTMAMPWYEGPSVLEALDAFVAPELPADRPFRLPVQDVYKFTAGGDDRRIIAGTIASGSLRVGDDLVFYPSGKRGRVRTIEAFNAPPRHSAGAGMATGFTLEEQVYVTRGELAARATEPAPAVTTRLRASLFWLGQEPLVPAREYLLKLGTTRIPARLEAVHRILDATTLDVRLDPTEIGRHEVAECTLHLDRALACDDAATLPTTGRFVLVDRHEIRGGGIVREALPDPQQDLRALVMRRNRRWEPSTIAPDVRARRYGHPAALVLVTGPAESRRKAVAKAVEALLFNEGHMVYYLGMAGMVYGVDADLARAAEHRQEHLRRLGEVANIMLDAGMILVVSVQALTREDLSIVETAVSADRVALVWAGDALTTDATPALHLQDEESDRDAAARVRRHLVDRNSTRRPE